MTVDNIRELLVKFGISTEGADQICETINNYATAVKENADKDYAQRVEAAKKICLEEVETNKLELARRVQVFCEAYVARIEQTLLKQSTLREGQSTQLLERVKSILEGIEVTDHDGAVTELTEAKKQLTKLQADYATATTRANRQTEIAERVLKRSRLLESEVVRLRRQADDDPGYSLGDGQLDESAGQPMARPAGLSGAGRPVNGDDLRRSGQPRTTRPTLTESQSRVAPRAAGRNDQRQPVHANGVPTPDEIGDLLSDGPPM